MTDQFVPADVYDKLLPQNGAEYTLANDQAIAEAEEAAEVGAKPITEPAAAEPEKPVVEEPAAEPAAAKPSDTDRLAQALADVAETLKKVDERLAAPEPEPAGAAADEVPAHIKLLLESDDARDQAIGQELLENRKALAESREREAARDQAAHETAMQNAANAAAEYIEAVGAKCDPPLTEAEKDLVVDQMTASTDGKPALAQSGLTFEQGVSLFLPGRLKPAAPTNAAPSPGAEGSRPVVQSGQRGQGKAAEFLGGGSAGPQTAQVRTPPKNETLEQAIARGMHETGLSRPR